MQRIAVDEYQDVNPLQQAIYFRLAELMPEEIPTLVVVGDDDQALYRFRGGDRRLPNRVPRASV